MNHQLVTVTIFPDGERFGFRFQGPRGEIKQTGFRDTFDAEYVAKDFVRSMKELRNASVVCLNP
jgi:hypothetical protein